MSDAGWHGISWEVDGCESFIRLFHGRPDGTEVTSINGAWHYRPDPEAPWNGTAYAHVTDAMNAANDPADA